MKKVASEEMERNRPMRVVVTGAAGFIGSHVAEILAAGNHEVLAIDDLSGGFEENVPARCRFEHRGVETPLDSLFESFRPEAVYHLAAYAAEGLSHHIPVFNYRNNVLATANVLAAAFRCGTRHFTFTSSIAAYGPSEGSEPFSEDSACRPCDPYGIAKLACEQQILSTHRYYGRPDYTIFRPHNVFGPRQNVSDPYRNVVAIFMRCAREGKPMPIFGGGTQTRSFSYIDAVARSIAAAPMTAGARNRIINVGGDEPMSVRDLARTVADVMGVPFEVDWLPARKEVAHAHCRHDLSRSLFPEAYAGHVGIAEGLQRMADFVRSRPIPPPTECPAPIEIPDGLPPSWAERLR